MTALLIAYCIFHIVKCKTPIEDRMLRLKFEFDETLPRLNNFGFPATMPDGHAGQVPQFGRMSVHWIELVPNYLTAIGAGEVIYTGPTTTPPIIDHSKAIIAGEGVFWLNISLLNIASGTYKYIRTSVAYQEYAVRFNLINNLDEWITTQFPIPAGFSGINDIESGTGYVQSFVGVNTYIGTIYSQGLQLVVNDNKLQGFGTLAQVFDNDAMNQENRQLISWDGIPNATTVPNPLWQSVTTPPG